jgi:flagellar FliJ protein
MQCQGMSQTFRFSLDKVLDYRAQREEEARLDVVRAEERHRRQEALLNSLKTRLAQAEADLAGRDVTGDELWLFMSFRQGLTQQIDQAEVRLRELADELQTLQATLAERAMERKLLERLKERRKEAHMQDLRRKEEQEYAELGALRFGRQAL